MPQPGTDTSGSSSSSSVRRLARAGPWRLGSGVHVRGILKAELRRFVPVVATLVGGLLAVAAPAAAVTLPAGFSDVSVATGLTGPTAVASAPDGRMFVAEKAGRVRVVDPDGRLVSAPLVDISDHVNGFADRGLLGIAVDSDFAVNRYLYLFYVHEANPLQPTAAKTSRVTRVEVKADNTVANPADPETLILGSASSAPCPAPSNSVDCLPADAGTHAIGGIRSDADGTLWVGVGDGASPGFVDPRSLRSYDEASFSGKVLHVDRVGRGLPGHPFCPADADLSHVCTKLQAKGFRYPFKLELRAGAGPLVADVGWNSREELDVAEPGGNYGWPCYEGSLRTPGHADTSACAAEYAKEGTSAASRRPIYDYDHDGLNSAIIGGPVYKGSSYPADYRGNYFFGDSSRRYIKRVTLDGDRVTNVQTFGTGWIEGPDLELSPGGDLVYVDFGNGGAGTGSLHRISFAEPGGNQTPQARATAASVAKEPPYAVAFVGSRSSDPDGDGLSYRWTFGDGHGYVTADPTHTYAGPGTYTARLTVSDGRGGSSSAEVTVTVGGEAPPKATILQPSADSTYRGGETIALRGAGTNGDGKALASSSLSWHVILHHGDHVHDYGNLPGAETSFTVATDHDADSYFEIELTATSESGLTGTEVVEIRPERARLSLESEPDGAPLSYAGTAVSAPFSKLAAVGFLTTISAPSEFVVGDRTYRFSAWSDGGDRVHDITIAGSATTLTARYAAVRRPLAVSFEYAPEAPQAGRSVSFRSTASAPDGSIVRQAWDLDGDGHFQDASGPTASRTYTSPGTYTVRLFAQDETGASGIATRTVTVSSAHLSNQPPAASFEYHPANPIAADVVRFRSTSVDADGSVVRLAWDLNGDGHFQEASGITASRSFPEPGSYRVGLWVQDDSGGTSIATLTVTVGARAAAAPFSTAILNGGPLTVLFGHRESVSRTLFPLRRKRLARARRPRGRSPSARLR